MDDTRLAERARGGDLRAFGELIQRYQEIAFRATFLITGDPADAEDAMQEAFLKVFTALNRFEPGRPFRPWLLRIVTNEARNHRRSARRSARLRQQLTSDAGVQIDQHAPDAGLLAAEQREQVLEGLAGLPEHDQIVLTYYYFLDLSVSEIAAILDSKPSTIRSRLLRARNRLRERIDPETNDAVQPEPSNAATWKRGSHDE